MTTYTITGLARSTTVVAPGVEFSDTAVGSTPEEAAQALRDQYAVEKRVIDVIFTVTP